VVEAVDIDAGEIGEEDVTQDRLMNVREVAEFLGLAPGTIYHLASQRRIPVVRLSARCLKFRQSRSWRGSKTNHKRRKSMDVKIDGEILHIELDLEEPRPSGSGKTLVVAGTGGRWRSNVKVAGKTVWLIATAYVYPDTPPDHTKETGKKGAPKKSASQKSRKVDK